MSNLKLYKRDEIKGITDSIMKNPRVLKLLEHNKDFLNAEVTRNLDIVGKRMKIIFYSIKDIAIEKLRANDFDVPSIYFLLTTFHQEGMPEDQVDSLTITFRARKKDGTNIKLKQVVSFSGAFYNNFINFLNTFFSEIVESLAADHNLASLNNCLLVGTQFWNHQDDFLDSEELKSLFLGPNLDGEIDISGLFKSLQDQNRVLPAFSVSSAPIVDINKKFLALGVSQPTLVNSIDDKAFTVICNFFNSYQNYLLVNQKISSENEQYLQNKKKKEQKEEKEMESVNKTIAAAFYGLDDVLEDDSDSEEVNQNHIEVNNHKISELRTNLLMDWIQVEPKLNDIYGKLYSAQNTIEFLNLYSETIMGMVVTNPSKVRTKRVAPLLKDSFYSDPEEFKDINDGLLFTYEREQSGNKLVYGKIVKKVDGEIQSVGLDHFVLASLSKMYNRRDIRNSVG